MKLIKIWTKTLIKGASLNTWSSSRDAATYVEDADQNLANLKKSFNQIIRLKPYKIEKFQSPEVCHKLRFLTFYRPLTLALAFVQLRWVWQRFWKFCNHICNCCWKLQPNDCPRIWYYLGWHYLRLVHWNLRR